LCTTSHYLLPRERLHFMHHVTLFVTVHSQMTHYIQFNHFQCHYIIIRPLFFWRNVDWKYWLIDWLVFNANFSSMSAISWYQEIFWKYALYIDVFFLTFQCYDVMTKLFGTENHVQFHTIFLSPQVWWYHVLYQTDCFFSISKENVYNTR
jgi:hypothetical protein